jgi:hypothetical protein
MCFSPQADLVAGTAVCAIGVDALRHVRQPRPRLVAALPLVLGGHQVVEALVWWGLQGRVAAAVWYPALYLYLAIAFGVVPVMVPLAVAALEPRELGAPWRRMGGFVVLGATVAAVLVYAVVRGPVRADIEGRHIAYHVDLWQGGALVALYALATCGSLLASSHRPVRWFGAINLIAVCLLAWLYTSAFISLWCLWAAVTSVAIDVHLRRSRQPRPGVVSATC